MENTGSTRYSVKNNSDKKKDAGEHKVEIELADKANTVWKNAESGKETDNIFYDFVIAPLPVDEPTKDTTKFVYNGGEQTYTVPASTRYSVKNNSNKKKDAGSYQVEIALTDKANTVWKNAETGKEITNLSYTFTIEKAELIIKASNVTAMSPEFAKFGYKVTGLIGSDELITEPTFEVIGGVIYPSGADAGSNYFITYRTGFFTGIVLPQIIPIKPTEPVVEPDEPVVEPDEPVVEPDEPVVEPDEPVVVEPVEKVEYTDVEAGAWYEKYVDFMTENGYMNGIGDGKFGVNNKMTRGMFITTLWRFDGEKYVNYSMRFSDVMTDEWYTEAVRWGASEKIVNGYSDENYGINDAITREQLITILYRYAEKLGLDVSVDENTNFLSYDDVFEISEYARPAMFWALENGIINGTGESTLSPKNDATRVQVAAIFERFCELLETLSVAETEAE